MAVFYQPTKDLEGTESQLYSLLSPKCDGSGVDSTLPTLSHEDSTILHFDSTELYANDSNPLNYFDLATSGEVFTQPQSTDVDILNQLSELNLLQSRLEHRLREVDVICKELQKE